MELENKNKNDTSSVINTINSPKKSDNIFEELSGTLDFGDTQDEYIGPKKKDKVYYLKLINSNLVLFNVIILIGISLLYGFLVVQDNETLYNKGFLDPFCDVLLSSEMKNTGDYCSSVASLLLDYKKKKSDLEEEIGKKLSLIIRDTYVIENFVNSKEVSFLMDSKNSRLKVLNILSDFDRMKNDFSGLDKGMIYCPKISMISGGELDITCDANSSGWNGGIIGYSEDDSSQKVEGTSISIASSFLNFIERNSSYNFTLVEKPKVFTSDDVIGKGYTKKTTINFKLKYNNLKTTLSL
ncbi:MAG: hypothetical protein PHE25_05240 [Candidatus Gracilibacteria bacterium]|nr:hypothetical protein [Candidatus Gracilibacteria bacterium]